MFFQRRGDSFINTLITKQSASASAASASASAKTGATKASQFKYTLSYRKKSISDIEETH